MSQTIDTLKTDAQFYLDITNDNTPDNQARIALHRAALAFKDALSQLRDNEEASPEVRRRVQQTHALFSAAKVKYGTTLIALSDRMAGTQIPPAGATS